MKEIENIELSFLSLNDYHELKTAMIEAYSTMEDAYWKEHHIQKLIDIFPEGQVVIKIDNQIAGCALAIIIDYDLFEESHTYREITGNYTFNTHKSEGNSLYGIDVFIKKEFRGLRLGRRLYDYRKELCEKLNLRRIVFGGRIPNYHQYKEELSPKEYIERSEKKKYTTRCLTSRYPMIFIRVKCLPDTWREMLLPATMPCCWSGTTFTTKSPTRNRVQSRKL